MRAGFFVREALRSLSRNAVPSFAAMATVLVTLLMLGVFIPIVQATSGAANEVRSRVLVDVYLKTGSDAADIARVRAKLTGDTPHVKRVEFVSKEAAFKRESKRNREAFELLGSNPLPDAFRVTPADPGEVNQLRDALLLTRPDGTSAPFDPAVDEVRNKKDDTDKILTATRVVKLSMGGLLALLVIASVLLIGNTIRLSLFARRREVEVMKLVGATDWFIRWPFVMEGVLVGAMGALVAILLLGVVKVALIDPLKADFALIAAPDTVNFGVLIIVLAVSGVLVSAAGSGLSLRRFLRV